MTNSQRLSTVRELLVRWLAERMASEVELESSAGGDDDSKQTGHPILSESILIRDGFYCGRRFDLGTHRAVWFLEEDTLKIFSSSGELECVLSGEELQIRDNAAAQHDGILRIPAPSERVASGRHQEDEATAEQRDASAQPGHRRAA